MIYMNLKCDIIGFKALKMIYKAIIIHAGGIGKNPYTVWYRDFLLFKLI